jgi:hypothetical protein
MRIKDMQNFRWWYKTFKRGRGNDRNTNENFVGTYHEREGQPPINGFFELYHGDKGDIPRYLPSILKIAEDAQAIYEFIQNAVDCGSTEFAVFYDKDYFLAINNGKPFKQEEVQSILNVAQSPKKSCDKIGRFGIGFKLVHRLVGKDDGTQELTEDYKGPIVYSWSRSDDLKGLVEKHSFRSIQHRKENAQEYHKAAWLFKILLTNFPVGVGEEVRDLNYDSFCPFPAQELEELQVFLQKSFSSHLNWQQYQTGSLFFIKLGEDKRDLLDGEKKHLESGIGYSMNMLKRLNKVYLNDTIIKKEALELIPLTIHKDTEDFKMISPDYKDCDIKASFGYYSDASKAHWLKGSPNIFKFFPMGDEANGFGFILHCDSFDNEANRRKLMESNSNRWLLNKLARLITEAADDQNTSASWASYCQIYSALLLSDIPKKDNKTWMKEPFFSVLLQYIQKNVPSARKTTHLKDDVKLKRTQLRVEPADFGCQGKFWFFWPQIKANKEIVDAAKDKEKLGLEEWKLSDLIANGSVAAINAHFINQNEEFRTVFRQELNKSITDFQWKKDNNLLFNKFKKLKVYPLSNGVFVSLEEMLSADNSFLLLPKVLSPIRHLLQKINFTVSQIAVDEDSPSDLERLVIQAVPYLNNKLQLFSTINQKLSDGNFSPQEKQLIFKTLLQVNGINYGTLRAIALFKNNAGKIVPLQKMIDGHVTVPVWLKNAQIDREEYFHLMDSQCFVQNAYGQVVYPHWKEATEFILTQGINVTAFYQDVLELYQDNKGTPLNDKNYIYTITGTFELEEAIFYDGTALSQEEAVVLSKLTGLKNPAPEIVLFLSQAPFKTEKKTLLNHLKTSEVELDVNEVEVLFRYCEQREIKLLERAYFNSDLELKADQNKIQYFLPDEEANQFVKQHFSEQYVSLPDMLDTAAAKKLGLRHGSNFLTESIIPRITSANYKEFVTCGALESIGTAAQIAFLKRVIDHSEIKVILDISGQSDHFLPTFIKLCTQHFDSGHEYRQKLRNKLYLPEIENYPLSQQTIQPAYVTTQTDEAENPLQLPYHKLFPEDRDQVTEAIEKVRAKYRASIPNLEELLAVSETNAYQIWLKMTSAEFSINEPEQFAFLVCYSQNGFHREFPSQKDYSSLNLLSVVKLFYKASITNWKDRFDLLGDKKKAAVYYPSAMVIKPEEKMPLALEAWMNEDIEREKYLRKIGVNTKQSTWYQLRRILLTGAGIDKAEEVIAKAKSNSVKLKVLIESIIEYRPTAYTWEDKRLAHFNHIFQFLNKQYSTVKLALVIKGDDPAQAIIKNISIIQGNVAPKLYGFKPEYTEYLPFFLEHLEENSFVTFSEYAEHIQDVIPAENHIDLHAFDYKKASESMEEWSAPEYTEWSNGLKVFLIDGEIPFCKTVFSYEVPGSKFTSEDSYQEGQNIYINKNVDPREQLRQQLKEKEYNALYSLPLIEEIGVKLAEAGIRSLSEIETLIAFKKRLEQPSASNLQPEPGDNRPADTNDGTLGEQLIYRQLAAQFGPSRVKLVAQEEPKYDIEVLDESEREVIFYIEVKSTTTGEYQADKIPINIRNGEWNFLMTEQAKGKYYIARIFNVNSDNPTIRWLRVEFNGSTIEEALPKVGMTGNV